MGYKKTKTLIFVFIALIILTTRLGISIKYNSTTPEPKAYMRTIQIDILINEKNGIN